MRIVMSKANLWGVLLVAASLCGQTKVDLQNQSRGVDFSNATFTKPAKVVFTLPATCTIGESAFLTSAPDGHNVYGCTATNQWTLQSGNGLPTGSAGGRLAGTYPFPDLAANRTTTSSSVVTTGAGVCAANGVSSVTHSTGTISRNGGTDSGLFTIACNALGALECYYSAGITIGNYAIAGFSGLTCTAGVPDTDITILATVPITNGAFQTPTDLRPDTVVATRPSVGAGLVSISNGIALDASLVPQMFFGTTAPGSVAGNLPGNWYTDTANHVLYECQKPAGTSPPACTAVAAGNWTVIPGVLTAGVGLVSILNGLAVDTTMIPQMFFGASAPGSVTGNLPGNLYTDTTNKIFYQCQKPTGTVAPACTGVATGDWTAIPGATTLYSSGHATISASGVLSYLAPLGQFDAHETVLANAQLPVPKAGTISNVCAFYVGATTYADQPVTITLNVNGTDDANMSATLPVSSATGTTFCTPSGRSATVSASDKIAFMAKYTGTGGTVAAIRSIYWNLQ